jgi:hypothetical protein
MKIDGKISGAVFRHVETELGISYIENEKVIEVRLKSHEDSNSTNVYVLSLSAVSDLMAQLKGLSNAVDTI